VDGFPFQCYISELEFICNNGVYWKFVIVMRDSSSLLVMGDGVGWSKWGKFVIGNRLGRDGKSKTPHSWTPWGIEWGVEWLGDDCLGCWERQK
jgi:hypothetical protein